MKLPTKIAEELRALDLDSAHVRAFPQDVAPNAMRGMSDADQTELDFWQAKRERAVQQALAEREANKQLSYSADQNITAAQAKERNALDRRAILLVRLLLLICVCHHISLHVRMYANHTHP